MRDAIDMAREAGAIHIHGKPKEFALVGNDNIKAFEALVRADERNKVWSQKHWTEYEQAIVAAEREACAKVCDEVHAEYDGEEVSASWIAAAIRARGNT